jgi:hypothetical protein
MDTYDELTEKRSRGGDMQAQLNRVISTWEDLNGDLDPKISEAEGFSATLESLRKGLDEVEKTLEEIAADESVEAETPPEETPKKK